MRSITSANHTGRVLSVRHACFSHTAGMRSRNMELIWLSMESEMLRAPWRPSWRSMSDLRMVPSRPFIRSHSWISTTRYGVRFSAGPMRLLMSKRLKSSGSRSRKSCTILPITSSLDCPPPPLDPPPMSMSCMKSMLHSVCRKEMSALGCRPKATGFSGGRFISMCCMKSSQFPLVFDLKPSNSSWPSWYSSGTTRTSRYVTHVRRSHLSVMCPPYMISPKMYLRSA
mmetsp:Transcript_45433/g.92847  ORF Transcript_45433/g.92847 Transcript_45433/m.92847 type:complete len:227 (+) Transcript_45433:740-1420(+)